jgi:hypothetical protein
MATSQQPTFTAYAVSKRGDGRDDWWNPIGAAFQHEDGEGYNIILQALPIGAKIVLRPAKKDEVAEQPPANNGKRRQENAGRSRR